jgi:hypothetical protein
VKYKPLVDELREEAERLQSVAQDVASDVREIADMAAMYFERSTKHRLILAKATDRISEGVERDTAYRLAADEMLLCWPDAFGYGEALAQLKAQLFGEKP